MTSHLAPPERAEIEVYLKKARIERAKAIRTVVRRLLGRRTAVPR